MASFVLFAWLDESSWIHLKDREILSTAIDRVIAEPLLWYKLHQFKWQRGPLRAEKKKSDNSLHTPPHHRLSLFSREKKRQVKKIEY